MFEKHLLWLKCLLPMSSRLRVTWKHFFFWKNQEGNALVSKLDKQSPLSLQEMLSNCCSSYSKLGTSRNGTRGQLSLSPGGRGRFTPSNGVLALRAADPARGKGIYRSWILWRIDLLRKVLEEDAPNSPLHPLFCPKVRKGSGGIWCVLQEDNRI